MKIRLSVVVPLLILAIAAIGFEQLTLPYVSFGSGRWSDSLGTNVSNRSSRINGNLNITGNFYKNGLLFSGGGGSPVSGSDENVGLLPEITGLDFVGNTFTATGDTGSGLLTLTSTLDTNKLFYRRDSTGLAGLQRNNTYTGANTFSGLTFTGVTETGNTTVTGTLDVNGVATFYSSIQLRDNTLVVTASGPDIYYQVTNGGAHIFETESGTDLLKVDSTDGTVVSGYVQLGPSAPLEAVKLIRFKIGQPNTTTTSPHGLDHNSIIGWTCTIRDDTTNTQVNPGSWYSPWVFYARIESLNVSVTIPNSPMGNSVANDTAFFRIVYRK